MKIKALSFIIFLLFVMSCYIFASDGESNTVINNNELIEGLALKQSEYICNNASFGYLKCMNISLNACEQDLIYASAYCVKIMKDQVPDLTKAEQTMNFEDFDLFGRKIGHCLIDWHIQELDYDSNRIYECLKLDKQLESESRGHP